MKLITLGSERVDKAHSCIHSMPFEDITKRLHLFFLQLEIEDFVPTLLYFGYTLIMVFSFWLLTGTVGFFATYSFVRHIYAAVKID